MCDQEELHLLNKFWAVNCSMWTIFDFLPVWTLTIVYYAAADGGVSGRKWKNIY